MPRKLRISRAFCRRGKKNSCKRWIAPFTICKMNRAVYPTQMTAPLKKKSSQSNYAPVTVNVPVPFSTPLLFNVSAPVLAVPSTVNVPKVMLVLATS